MSMSAKEFVRRVAAQWTLAERADHYVTETGGDAQDKQMDHCQDQAEAMDSFIEDARRLQAEQDALGGENRH